MNAAVHHPSPTQPRPDPWGGRHLYRFLDEEKYADDFAQGRFRITTLRRVRAHEKLQGDVGEGSEWYFSDSHGSGDPGFEEIAARTGITIGPAAHDVTIRWNVTHRVVWDAYLLCLTKSFDPGRFAKDFGNFCCEITGARRFFDLVTDRLTGRPDWQCAEMCSVTYGQRTHHVLDFASVPSTSYTNGVKAKLMAEAGLDSSHMSEYELDHIIPLAVGGHPRKLSNLQLQPWYGQNSAVEKDGLEVRLQHMVCKGQITLLDAQYCIAEDWQACEADVTGGHIPSGGKIITQLESAAALRTRVQEPLRL